MKQKYLTTSDIAKYCHVTQRTVVQWVNDGKIKVYRTPGNHTRVSSEDFIVFLKKYNMPVPKEFCKYDGNTKVLIVDDDKNMAYSIKRILKVEMSTLEVEIALDGFDAGRKLLLFAPNIIILDIRMPGLSGYEVAEKIKNTPGGECIKILAISAFFDSDGKERITALGAEACLDKPFNETELLGKIKDFIREQKEGR